jgi:gluconolactonase
MNTLLVALLAVVHFLTCAATAHADPSNTATTTNSFPLEIVYEANWFFEGPVWDHRTGKLFFTAYRKDHQEVLRLDAPGNAVTWMDNAQDVSGMTLTRDGRLLMAQAITHQVIIADIGSDGPLNLTTLYANTSLNQPNDVRQRSDGGIYFSDPNFKTNNSAVYFLETNGLARKVITNLSAPNGLQLSPDERLLYVSDSKLKSWWAYSVQPDGSLTDGRLFFKPEPAGPGNPDGITMDKLGTLYLTGLGGVWIVDSNGRSLGFIPVPGGASNVTFGGKDGTDLYITSSKKLYRVSINQGLFHGGYSDKNAHIIATE